MYEPLLHCKKNGKITGNQLPVNFPLFFTGAGKHFQESGTELRWHKSYRTVAKDIIGFFCHTDLQSYKGIFEYCRLT